MTEEQKKALDATAAERHPNLKNPEPAITVGSLHDRVKALENNSASAESANDHAEQLAQLRAFTADIQGRLTALESAVGKPESNG